MTTNTNLTDLIYEAQDLLHEAIALLDDYVRQTGDREASDYIVAHLKIVAGRDHGYLSRDLNLDDLLERVSPDEPEGDEPEEDEEASDPNRFWSSAIGRYVTIPTGN